MILLFLFTLISELMLYFTLRVLSIRSDPFQELHNKVWKDPIMMNKCFNWMHSSILIGHFVKENIRNIRNTFPSPVSYKIHSLQVLLQTLACLHKKLFCWLATISGLAAAEWWQTRQDRILGKVLEHTKIFWQLTGQVRETLALHFPKENLLLACDHIWSHGSREMTNWSFGCSLLGRRPVWAPH